MYATGLVCANCGDSYPLEARFACDRCFGPVEPGYDNAAIRRDITREKIEAGPRTLWRYADLLPVRPVEGALPVGCTPLIPVPRLAAALGLRELYIKVEGANPTHSFKDRVVSVASAKAVELGLDGARLRVDRQPRRRRRRPGRGARARRLHLRARPTWSARRSSPPPCRAPRCSRSRATTTTSTGSAPSSPTSGRGPSSTSTCAPTTRRARRRWRSRRPSSSAGGCPTRSWRRSPPARCSTRCTRATRS